ncbi:MAG: PSD1 and planctomycete cytochrome C domain-containing protein [Pirellulales bacterium]
MLFMAATCLNPQLACGEDDEFYKTRIEPVLKKSCLECHSHATGEASGNLMLDSQAGVTAGGTRGTALVAGKPEASLMIRAIEYGDADFQMPPDGKLAPEVIADFKKWIADGAKGLPAGVAPAKTGIQRLTADNAQTHWAYRLPVKAPLPDLVAAVQAKDDAALDDAARSRWSRHIEAANDPIDVLIRAKLLETGIEPSAEASRRDLARRAYYDLTGLPPSAAELAAFVNDARPTEAALAALIDRLSASPHFGERWARYWMDVARYADTKGYVFREDREYAEAFRYRDWLIQSFNDDLPYDRFVKSQLAGDMIDPENAAGQVPALGFLTLGRRFLNNKQDIIDDRLDVTARGLMGLTLACARCHDHKYDPVDQADYYALYGVFLNTEEPGGGPWPHRLSESNETRKAFVFLRGQAGNRGPEVPKRFVGFLSTEKKPFERGSGREELAESIASGANPLTARVFVNRVWMRLFGASLVDSPSDFGVRCPAPKQQDVLDHLAVDFVAEGWDVKRLIRRLMLSAVYRQSSLAVGRGAALDTENSLLWRMNRRRMDFESLRDATLSVTGQLETKVLGPSEKIHEIPYSKRRTVYAYIDRQNLPGLFRNFDVASPDAHSPQRLPTTVPQQGLYLLNSQFETMSAKQLGDAIQAEASVGDGARAATIKKLFQSVLSRDPDAEELVSAGEFLSATSPRDAAASLERWICGWGEFDPATGKLNRFERLPFYNGKSWQGGNELPDAKLGWVMLNRDGGHPGNDLQHAAVRRWIAPKAGFVSVRGRLNHPSDQGDGVRGSLISDRQGRIQEWLSKKQETRTEAAKIQVEQGEILDFVTDCLESPTHDGFQWKVRIRYEDGGEFDSSREFPGPVMPPLSPIDQLVQALLASNEFAFID